ncbi:carbohydrate ABC transporter permease [Paenibacillus mendelii]|uniref:Carbohydrate ABC transporter permease n=1 Tax=Paenibacillus mendelii TaxID=206163 RepID=A0ABV6J3R5_9BACL|nr:sugar ABC transporter permease [Paenibacillus mendelii]MCQ6561983.1 sugar ABC transporter permease [Paenibacillus mendelii]
MQKRMFITGIFFVAPITIILAIFLFFPILQSVYYSFTDWKGVGGYSFVGFSNYLDIFNDESFTNALKRTLLIGIAAAVLTNLCGLLFALMLDQALKTKSLLRALFYIPNVIPIVVAAFVWRYMLDANSGLLNEWLSKLTGDRIAIPWIDSPDYVVYSIIAITVWQMWGPIMIIYLAALQGIPQDMKEATMIDGASKWRRFISLTLPMIAPGITVNVLIGLANGLRIFDLPFALTGGGPAGSSETLAVKIYRYAFSSTELSLGLASSFVLTICAMVVTFFFIAISRQYEKGVM